MVETKRIDASDRVFELAAELFSLLATPTRLRIVCELREGEKSVGELLDRLDVSQPNISQHLGTLYRAGVLGRRRAGSQVYYRLGSEHAQLLCEAVCAERQLEVDRQGRTRPAQ
ncbi:MAG: transcriptional regulator [Rubrivivax sp. SCN 70-15]|jgi:ArsR family transcriptional regulator|nr:MAG: transcriptional regulator [Rubrivivax sp. SCN 70-15]